MVQASRHRRSPSDASALSFAVIYDPENGLQSFAEPVLPAYDDASSYYAESSSHHERSSKPLSSNTVPFALFGGRRSGKHFLNIRTSSLFERRVHSGGGANTSSPVQSDFSKSIYSQESGTDESAGGNSPPTPTLSPTTPRTVGTRPALRPKMSFKMPSLYGRVSFYRKKPTKATSDPTTSDMTTKPHAHIQECSSGPKLYTLLHRVHNASCSAPSHSEQSTCCNAAAEKESSSEQLPEHIGGDIRWFRLRTSSEDYSPSHDNGVDSSPQQGTCEYSKEYSPQEDICDLEASDNTESWSDFDYDPRLPSRFSVTTTSTSTYVEIDMDALSFDEPVQYHPAPFDDVQRLDAPAQPRSPKRMMNPWRPKF